MTAPSQAAPTTYSISARLGIFDADHTDSAGVSGQVGFQESYANEINNAGMVAGDSLRFVGVTAEIFDNYNYGQSAWVYNGSTTTRVGLFDALHTSVSGLQNSRVNTLTEAGNAYGYSSQYNGDQRDGDTAWYYNAGAGTTTFLGLTDAEHTGSGGVQASELSESHRTGYAIGVSDRYDGSGGYHGQSAWLHDGTTLTALGLTDAEHTASPSGLRISSAKYLNSSGQVAGKATRYYGESYNGQSVWFYDGSTTTQIGLLGAEYTSANDYKNSQVKDLNEAGQVAGDSWRYDNTTGNSTGSISWIYDSGAMSTRIVGFYDVDHTRNDGTQNNYLEHINEAGQAYGSARQYNGSSSEVGNSVWYHDGIDLRSLGLRGVGYTNADGGSNNFGRGITETGKLMGVTDTYDGSGNSTGTAAWVFDGTTTSSIGLTSPALINAQGGYEQWVVSINEAGFVAGSTQNNFVTASWIYDPISDMTHEITVPLGKPLGPNEFLFSGISLLGESGDMLGSYEIYNVVSNVNVDRGAFYWSLPTGTILLDDLIEGGLSAAGWQELTEVGLDTNLLGQLVGYGLDDAGAGMSKYGFVLTPVPEPASLVLLCLGSLTLLRRRKT